MNETSTTSTFQNPGLSVGMVVTLPTPESRGFFARLWRRLTRWWTGNQPVTRYRISKVDPKGSSITLDASPVYTDSNGILRISKD